MNNFNKITVNGKEYNSISEVPDEFKVLFKDENNNGIPDFVEGLLAGANDIKNTAVQTSGNNEVNANFTSFFYNGQQYKDMNQLPPEAKQMVEKGLGNLEKSGMKIATGFTGNPKNENGNAVNLSNMGAEQKDVMQELNPGFKFRLIMTIILFIMAVVYIVWLAKLI
ncbi:MAG: hypothetical protein ABI543_03915 [Ignavibacteria bacterium]